MKNLGATPFTKEFGYIRLARILRPGSTKLNAVLKEFGNIERINSLTLKEWIESRILTPYELARIEKIDSGEIYEIIKYCKFNDIRIITPEDDEYPYNFKLIENPPTVIYARGKNLKSLEPMIGVVGARKSTEFGNKAAYSLSAKLALSGFTVISGGAVGVDSMAHTGALNAGGNTIVVLGCGMDSDYLPVQEPLRKRAELCGAVISEFEPKTVATKYTFPIRNRLISALSCGVAVIEAALGSGALITATYAMEQGKEIFALPGNINLPQYGGTNELLRDGAIPLISIEDIVGVYKGRFPDKIKVCGELSKEIKQGYSHEVQRLYSKKAPPTAKQVAVEVIPDYTPEEKSDKKTSEKSANAQKPVKKSSKAKKTAQKAEEGLAFEPTAAENLTCSENAKKIYLSFTENIEFSDTLSLKSGVVGGEFIAAVTELELFGYLKAVPVGRYERIK